MPNDLTQTIATGYAGRYFLYNEFLRESSGVIEWADVDKVNQLVKYILDPLRASLGSAVIITSGKRSPSHNRRCGGARHSDHLYINDSAAADFTCRDLRAALRYLATVDPDTYGQLIYYPDRHFIHVSLPTEKHQGEALQHNGQVSGYSLLDLSAI